MKFILLLLISFSASAYNLNEQPCGDYKITGKVVVNKAAEWFILMNPKTDIEQYIPISKLPPESLFEWADTIVSLDASLIGKKSGEKSLVFKSFSKYESLKQSIDRPHV
jgi:hypothetical protein